MMQWLVLVVCDVVRLHDCGFGIGHWERHSRSVDPRQGKSRPLYFSCYFDGGSGRFLAPFGIHQRLAPRGLDFFCCSSKLREAGGGTEP